MTSCASSSNLPAFDIETAVQLAASNLGLIPNAEWVDRCVQLYNLSNICRGKLLSCFYNDAFHIIRIVHPLLF